MRRIERFVRAGGLLYTTDWALKNVVEQVFPNTIKHNGMSTGDEVVPVLVDDGLATGSTMIAALHSLRGRHPARLICAVPVAPSDVVEKIGAYADEVVCLHTPEKFQAVGQFYRHFDQVEDDQVTAVLGASQGARLALPGDASTS